MRVAVVVFVVGDKYVQQFDKTFRPNLAAYCAKHGYDLVLLTSLIRPEANMDKKKFFWQRLLIPEKFQGYDYVVSMDSDIYVNPAAPPLPEIPEGKVGAVNERKYGNNYEWREAVQVARGWERTGKEWHALSGETRPYDDHINAGLVVYQPKHHAAMLRDLYDKNVANYMKYHQDDQSILSLFLIDHGLVHWIDERFNRIWFFWKELFYPNFDQLPPDWKRLYVHRFTALNHFTHFTGGTDIQYL